ncbi:hypothetical protein B0T16DRAFT_403147 [Cercophora newfieldiana]|uniref:CorA-like transporter domain-containing protein n=1 Tax=Cercophora newfieldiana TaxID=92897 RepID=A0AA40CTL9_9PEZI|nr:hypothetical protein B0T16DRAFT_403147 [Cercophora newfieldiana]
MSQDSVIDRFRDAQRRATEYPGSSTLLRNPAPHEVHRHSALSKLLQKSQSDLFNDDDSRVEILESNRGDFLFSTHESAEGLRRHFDRGSKDPHIRHAFVRSPDSRSPLDCSLEMFQILCTHQQVDASFLDDVQAFGDQDEPKDLCLASVEAHHTLHSPRSALVELAELGRSGKELRIHYLLRSVEAGNVEVGQWPWQIRQSAVYHTFDVETGRTFWLTAKGNAEFRDRIQNMSEKVKLPSPASPILGDEPASLFRISLSTHLVYLQWCDENWRQCINDLESFTQDIKDNARTAPIDDHQESNKNPDKLAHYPRSLGITPRNSGYSKSKHGTQPSSNRASHTATGLVSGPRGGSELRKQSTWEVIKGAKESLASLAGRRIFSGWRSKKGQDLEMAGLRRTAHPGPAASSSTSVGPLVHPCYVLDAFRFRDIQTLHTFSDRIRRYILTIDLDISVLDQIHAFYSDLLTSEIDSFRKIKTACMQDLIGFLAEVRSISRSLAVRKKQLECLAAILAQGITLYDGILQQRQIDIAQRFQETAQRSAVQMKVIASKAKLETASMHVITIVTLIFLPATFVATFFQSGAIELGEVGESYLINPQGMSLFGAVAGVVTFLTVGTWLVVYATMKSRLKKELEMVLPK